MARPTRRRDPFRDGQTTAVTVVEQGAVELSYDYSRLPEEERAAVQRGARHQAAAATHCRGHLRDRRRSWRTSGLLPHGRYTEWLGAEFGLSERMAQHFVNVRERLGPKSEKFSVLPPSTLYMLAAPSTPDAAIAQVEAHLAREGRVTVRTVQHVIAAAKAQSIPEMLDEADLRLSAYNAEQAAVRRLERALTDAILLLSGPSARDWAQLFGDGDEAGELARVRDEALALREAVRRRIASSP